MNAFTYKDGQLFADDIAVSQLADEYGTPLYVYSRTHMIEQFRALTAAMNEVSPQIYFAIKSNSNAAVINTFVQLGAGADVVSAGELFRATRAGVDPAKICFAGVGKTVEEIDYALQQGIHCFTVESESELARISERSVALGLTGRIAIRVNPDVDPQTHKYTSTGKKESKFGVDLERALRAYEMAASLPGIEICGLHMHIGSPIMTEGPYAAALEKVRPVCEELKKVYPTFSFIDIGGGFGIKYSDDQNDFDLKAFAEAVVPPLRELGLNVGMEPGRFLTGNAGLLVCRVQYVKDNPFKKFVVIDGAMNDLIRPALYQAHHDILPVNETSETFFGDVVGPVCESGDFFAFERDLPQVQGGELIAVRSAGAYGFTMSSNYNSRGRAAEVMVSGERSEVVRDRETWDDLVRGEQIPEW